MIRAIIVAMLAIVMSSGMVIAETDCNIKKHPTTCPVECNGDKPCEKIPFAGNAGIGDFTCGYIDLSITIGPSGNTLVQCFTPYSWNIMGKVKNGPGGSNDKKCMTCEKMHCVKIPLDGMEYKPISEIAVEGGKVSDYFQCKYIQDFMYSNSGASVVDCCSGEKVIYEGD